MTHPRCLRVLTVGFSNPDLNMRSVGVQFPSAQSGQKELELVVPTPSGIAAPEMQEGRPLRRPYLWRMVMTIIAIGNPASL